MVANFLKIGGSSSLRGVKKILSIMPTFVESHRKESTCHNVEDVVFLEDMIKEARAFVYGLQCNHDCTSTMEVSKAVAMAAFHVTG